MHLRQRHVELCVVDGVLVCCQGLMRVDGFARVCALGGVCWRICVPVCVPSHLGSGWLCVDGVFLEGAITLA